MSHRACGLLVLFVLALVGCETVQPPTAKLAGVRVMQQSAEAASLRLFVELQNPNDVALPLQRVQYQVSAGSTHLTYRTPANRTLPAKGTQLLELPAAVADVGLGASYEIEGTVEYRPPGEMQQILSDSGVALPTVSFSGSGTLEQAGH